jgi:cell division protein FtsW
MNQSVRATARRTLIMSTVLIVLIGLLFMYSASSIYARELHGSCFYFLKRQLIGLAIGLGAFFLVLRLSPDQIRKLTIPLFIAVFALTIATIIPGITRPINGSRRWIMLAGWSIQPSEFLKPMCVLLLASFIDTYGARIKMHVRAYSVTLFLVALPSLVLLKQPDFGQAATWTMTAVSMLLCANIPASYLVATVMPAFIGGLLLIVAAPYRLKRLTTFLNPWADPLGSGFQIIQSLIAIGSGGIAGTGLGASHQKLFYLPMQHTDFIFAIIAEEAGLIGSLTLLMLYTAQFISGMRLARSNYSIFTQLACFGLSTMLALQAFINIAVAAGLVPTKGIGLPFVSYGNSALIADLFCIGLMLALSKEDALHQQRYRASW